MNWLDTQTKEILQKDPDEKLSPPKIAEFALVLLRKGDDDQRMLRAVMNINQWNERDAAALMGRETPIVINPDLTEEEAVVGQFELICCDAISVFVRSEVLDQNERSYLHDLFELVSHSDEFSPTRLTVNEVPRTEAGQKFVAQFLGSESGPFPKTITVPYKKARIMEHWARRVGVEVAIEA